MSTVETSEVKLFRSTNADFIARTASVDALRSLISRGESYDRAWWESAAELGWSALLVPESRGGGSASGEGVRDLVGVAGLLGEVAAFGPLQPVSIVIAGMTHSEAVSPRSQSVLDELMAGTRVATWAVYEPNKGFDPCNGSVRAVQTEGGFTLSGVKDRVEAATSADYFLVTAASELGTRQFLVPSAAPGVRVDRSQTIDAVKDFGVLTLDEVTVAPGDEIGDPSTTGGAIRRQVNTALVLQMADTVGGLRRVFDMTVQWAFDRYTFGRPLASYQALKHRFADMRVWLEACEATLDAAVSAVQGDGQDADYLTSVAKSYIGDRSVEIIQDCVQLHGGIGVTVEHDLHLYLRRATLHRQLYGTPGEHRRHIATILGL